MPEEKARAGDTKEARDAREHQQEVVGLAKTVVERMYGRSALPRPGQAALLGHMDLDRTWRSCTTRRAEQASSVC